MSPLRALLLPGLLLAGCPAPPTVGPAPHDSEPVVDDSAPPGDDTAPPGDTDTEWIPHGEAAPVFDPPGGGFEGSVEVTITSSTGTGQVLACAGTPSQPCTPAPVTGPLTIDRSQVVIARVDIDGRAGVPEARSFVSMSAEVLAFVSPIPVLVFWTDRNAPSGDEIVPLALDLFEPTKGPASLSAAPTSSGRCRMKTRGSSTGGMSKHSYDLELWAATTEDDRPEPLAGLPADGDWVLYAPYYFDDALIRNALAYTLSERIGRYAPRTRMVELFVASGDDPVTTRDYAGVYTLTEEIERGSDRVDVTPISPDDVEEPEVTGGYVFKRDREGDGERGFLAGQAGGRFVFEEPLIWVDPEEREISPPQEDYLRGVIESFAWALVQPDFVDPVSGLHYGELIDVDSFIDHHILNVVFKNPDAFRLSGYMHKDRGGLVMAGPLWDFDRSAGAEDERAYWPTWWDASNQTTDTTYVFQYGWYGGLFEDPAFRERYWARWAELLEGPLSSESITALIDELSADLEEPAARNSARWGAAALPGEIEALKAWLDTRIGWIRTCLEQQDDPRECRG